MDSRRVELRGRGESPAELRRRPTKDELPVERWWKAEKGSRVADLIWDIGLKELTLVWRVAEVELTGDDDVRNLNFLEVRDLGSSREWEWRRYGRPPNDCKLEYCSAYGKWSREGRGLLKILWVSEKDECLEWTDFRNGDLETFAS